MCSSTGSAKYAGKTDNTKNRFAASRFSLGSIGDGVGPARQEVARASVARLPLAPVSGLDVDLLPGFCVNPMGVDATTGESERVRAIFVKNSQFKIAIDWRRRYGDILPLHERNLLRHTGNCFDLDQSATRYRSSAAKNVLWSRHPGVFPPPGMAVCVLRYCSARRHGPARELRRSILELGELQNVQLLCDWEQIIYFERKRVRLTDAHGNG